MSISPIRTKLSAKAAVSYFLLGKKIYFILNSNAKSGNVSEIIRGLSKSFPLYSFNILLSSATKVSNEITREVLSNDSLFIVMGGDGTINNAIQYLVNTPAVFGLIPKGTANDLASYFGISQNTKEALRVISQGHITKLDAIKCNSQYILTIGAVGFPAKVANSVNQFKAGNPLARFLHRYIFRSSIYKLFAFLLLAKGQKEVAHHSRVVLDDRLIYEGPTVATFFGKQPFLGKSFRPCPGVSHSDPFFTLSVLRYEGILKLLKDMWRLGRSQPEKVDRLIVAKANRFRIETDQFQHLLGDGEILDHDDRFEGKRVPQSINFLTPMKGDEA